MILSAMSRIERTALLLLLASAPAPLAGQALTWATTATLYGDNTEFFTPYRVGETILGGQFRSTLRFRTGVRTAFELGAFGDHRSGDEAFLETVHALTPVQYHRQ